MPRVCTSVRLRVSARTRVAFQVEMRHILLENCPGPVTHVGTHEAQFRGTSSVLTSFQILVDACGVSGSA